MTPEIHTKIRASLIEHEGKRNLPYVDTVGKITIGIGYNLTDRGLPDSWVFAQLDEDISYFFDQLSKFDWFNKLNSDRKCVLVDMCFNVGVKGFLEFKKMIEALQREDFKRAGSEMLSSTWASQVKDRANKLALGMLSGVYEP